MELNVELANISKEMRGLRLIDVQLNEPRRGGWEQLRDRVPLLSRLLL